jgi:hypothetical protein
MRRLAEITIKLGISRLHWYGGVMVLLPGYRKVGLEWPYNTPLGSESVTALSSWRM